MTVSFAYSPHRITRARVASFGHCEQELRNTVKNIRAGEGGCRSLGGWVSDRARVSPIADIWCPEVYQRARVGTCRASIPVSGHSIEPGRLRGCGGAAVHTGERGAAHDPRAAASR